MKTSFLRFSMIGLLSVGMAFSSLFAVAALTITTCSGPNPDVFPDGACPAPKDAKVGDDSRSGTICDSSTGQCVSYSIDPNFLGSLPAGWTESAGAQHPPPTAGSATTHYTTSQFCGANGVTFTANTTGAPDCAGYAAWAQACDRVLHPADVTVVVSQVGANCNICSSFSGGSCTTVTGTFGFATSAVCPPGYTNSSGTCTLSNAALVMKPSDGKCGVVRSGNTITNDSKDPDCIGSSSAATAFSSTASGGVLSASKGGQTLTVTIDGSTGVATISASAPAANGDTQSTRLQVGHGGASDGKVIGTASSTTAGGGTLGGSSPADKVDAKINESGMPSGSGALDASKAALDAVTPASLGKAAWAGAGHALPSDLPSIAGSAACVNPAAIHIFGVDVTMDICTLWAPLKSWFAWFLYAATALYMWRRSMKVMGA